MPTRPAVHIRGRRTWGTRFDTLNTSPVRTISSTSPRSSANSPETHQMSRSRDWADDEVPATILMSTDNVGATPTFSTPNVTPRLETPKMPHNASVFVGSLPPNVDEAELSRHLAQHLSQYAKIHNIKIIHDAKGGVCAFVQCETATQAAHIIAQSQANPKLFMGRQLRCESARAYRTLWISYRKPMQFIPSDDIAEGDAVLDESGVRGQFVEMDPPDAMRIWRPLDSRHPMICYKSEARNFDTSGLELSQPHSNKCSDAFDGAGVLFADLPFDGNTMQKIVAAFGPLESFKRCAEEQSQGNVSPGGRSPIQPPGHDGPRSTGMDEGVWEVKWEHRDDCVCALATLKRVPHLMVSKTTQPPQSSFQPYSTRQNFVRQPFSPRFPSINIPHSPLLLDRSRDQQRFRDAFDPFLSPSSSQSPVRLFSPSNTLPSPSMTLKAEGQEHTGSRSENTEGGRQSSTRWCASDFPPLRVDGTSDCRGSQSELQLTKYYAPVSEADVSEINESSSAKTLTNAEADHDSDNDTSNKSPDWSSPRHPPSTHRRSLSNPVPSLQAKDDAQSSVGEGSSHITPVTPTSTLPLSFPCPNFTCAGRDKCLHKYDSGYYPGYHTFHREQDIDPKTVFVGGLDAIGASVWGVDKLRSVFEKYGEVEDVRVICPSNKKTFFAFVTFSDESAPLRAIAGEHNRVYDGRTIRVQLRDRQPSRNMFKFRTRIASGRNRELHQEEQSVGRHEPWKYGRYHTSDVRNNEVNKTTVDTGVGIPAYMHAPEHEMTMTTERSFNGYNPRETHIALAAPVEAVPVGLPGHPHASNDVNTRATQPPADASTSSSVTPPPPFTPGPVIMQTTPSSLSQPGGYYAARGWPPYGAQIPFAMPYGAYPGLMTVPHPTSNQTNTSADGSASGMNASMQWGPIYRHPMQYAPYPYIPYMAPHTEFQGMTPRPYSPSKALPPTSPSALAPADHGVPAPMYQPSEASDDYTSGSAGTNVPSSHAPSPIQTYNTIPAPGNAMNTAQFWPGYTPHGHYYPYPMAPGAHPTMHQPMTHPFIPGQHYPSSSNGSWFQPATGSHAQMRPPPPHLSVRAPTVDSRPTPAHSTAQAVHSNNIASSHQQRQPVTQEQQSVVNNMNIHASTGRQQFRRDHYSFGPIQHGRNVCTNGGRSPSALRHSGKLANSGDSQLGQHQVHDRCGKDTLPVQHPRN